MSEHVPMQYIDGNSPPSGLVEASSSPAEQANFQGDWMLLQQQRMSSTDFRDKFNQFLGQHAPSLNEGEPGPFDKPTQFQAHYERQSVDLELNTSHVYAAVRYGKAMVGNGNPPSALGHGSIGEQGTIYSDGITGSGNPLTDRQKNIVAAHEAYHGMVDAQGSAVAEVRSGFDMSAYDELVDNGAIHRPSYLRNPDELLARMAQLKNYYGMSAGESFTAEHLDYARGHYVEDTGLDNGMSVFFAMVTPNTDDLFLHLMNKLPV